VIAWLILVAWASGVAGFGFGLFWRDSQTPRQSPGNPKLPEFNHDRYHFERWQREKREHKVDL
jgi:hypothetical protein